MTAPTPPRRSTRTRLRRTVVGLVLLTAVVAACAPLAGGSPSSAPSLDDLMSSGSTADGDGRVTEDDGRLPDGATVLDDRYPGVANLDPGLLDALRAATADAEQEGVTITVTSGWRSAEYQEQLLSDAVARYGSEAEAARWVATPDTSPHVAGEAVDVGPLDGMLWLSEHGPAYGLCQVYGNELWHYELRPDAPAQGCPPAYADPTQDPRMG